MLPLDILTHQELDERGRGVEQRDPDSSAADPLIIVLGFPAHPLEALSLIHISEPTRPEPI
eukprot:6498921-Pyramimonas_sp.AAC.1